MKELLFLFFGFGFGWFVRIGTDDNYWSKLTQFLDERDRKIIRQLSTPKYNDHKH